MLEGMPESVIFKGSFHSLIPFSKSISGEDEPACKLPPPLQDVVISKGSHRAVEAILYVVVMTLTLILWFMLHVQGTNAL